MRQNACNNGQDILNWFRTDETEFEFTETGYPIIEPITKDEIKGIEKTIPFHLASGTQDWDRWVQFSKGNFSYPLQSVFPIFLVN